METTHFRTRKLSSLIPGSRAEKILLAVLILGMPFSAWWIWTFMIPMFHDTFDKVVIGHMTAIAFLLYNAFFNFSKAITVDPSGDPDTLPVILKTGNKDAFFYLAIMF